MSTIVDDRIHRVPVREPAAGRRPSLGAGASAGVRDILPVATAVAPFAVVLGVAIDAASVHDVAGGLLAPVVYAGASQFAAMSVVDAGGTLLAAAGTGLVINARVAMYGAALASRFRGQPAWFRWIAPWTIVDQTFALASARKEDGAGWFRSYWAAISLVLGLVYTAMVGVGIVAGPVVGRVADLRLTVPALFVAMLVPKLRHRPHLVAAVVGAVTAALALALPHGLGLPLGALAGAVAGQVTSRRTS